MNSRASRDAVLLLTHSGDFYTIELVADALARMGARPFRLNTDRFPSSVKLSARAGDNRATHLITDAGTQLSTEEIVAVWARKLWTPQMDADLDERFREMCVRESVAALEGFLDALHDARWVNDIQRERAAENKQRQLRLAAQVGLRIPRTLVTNDPAAARQFFAETEGRMVAKLLRPLTVSMNAPDLFVYTSQISEADLANAETLRHSPMVFQEMIPKALELRTTVVGNRVMSASIDSQASARAAHDWRRDGLRMIDDWQPYELPREVEEKILRLMDHFVLNYGAIDIIVTPGGRHVFLEINPVGEFFWLKRRPGLPISDAIADVLLGRSPRRPAG